VSKKQKTKKKRWYLNFKCRSEGRNPVSAGHPPSVILSLFSALRFFVHMLNAHAPRFWFLWPAKDLLHNYAPHASK